MEEGCNDCHEPPEPAATVQDLDNFTECVTCHGEHRVFRASLAQLSPQPNTPCALCHEDPDPSDEELGEPLPRQHIYEQTRDGLLSSPEAPKEEDALFDWLVDQAQQLEEHTDEVVSVEGGRSLRLTKRFSGDFVSGRIMSVTWIPSRVSSWSHSV